MSKATDFLAHLGEAPQTSEQLQDASGEGEAAIIPRLEALRLRDFLNRVGDVMRLT